MNPNRHAWGEFLTTQSAQIPLNEFVVNLILTALFGFILGQVYVRFGSTLSNRNLFARNFSVLAMTTMLIISIVKSSLALSLGLVGALSIIRFRAAIKEPEELSYLFLAISIGLGFGASQTLLTAVAFFLIIGLIALKHLVRSRSQKPNFFLTITSAADPGVNLPKISAVLSQHASGSALTRLDETPEALEASFRVQFDSLAKLHSCNDQLRSLAGSVRVSYLEERGVGA
ncbi:MAG: DUF4956 domain-containing protein [Verrucomicrobia bacterium]|nr:DUF4956 domain-containing protein [Verrucomicrobiota bacterium]